MYTDLTAGQYALTDLARFALLAIVVPAGAWVRGRRLLHMTPDDEATAEEHWAWWLARRKLALIALMIWLASAFVWPVGCWLPEPGMTAFMSVLAVSYLGMILGLALLDYRMQKALKGLTCGLGRFLRMRAAFLLFSGWYAVLIMIVAAIPFLHEYSASPIWYAKFAALVAGLAAATVLCPRLSLRILGATREPPAELREAVERVAAQEGLAPPDIRMFPDRGTKSFWAFAMPLWPDRPAIIMSENLPTVLSTEETRAIALHELRHCDKRQMRARRLLSWAVLASLLIAMPTATTFWPEGGAFLVLGLLVCWAVLVGARRNQRYETQSDLFAAKHAGAEVTISALTKLHALSLLPRRFGAKTEQRLSHPGLARRIAAIQREPFASPPPVIELPPIRAEGARRRPVTLAVQHGSLVICSATPPGAESAPELVIPPDRILAAEVQQDRKTCRLRLQWADAEEELIYWIAEPEVAAARNLVASIDRHFMPPNTPCRLSMARAADSMFQRCVIIGGILALLGGLPLLVTALVNRRRTNIEVFTGYLVASIGAAACAAVAWDCILPAVRYSAIGATLVCLWPGLVSLTDYQRWSLMVGSKVKQPGRWLRRILINAAIIVGGVILGVVAIIALIGVTEAVGPVFRHSRNLREIISFLGIISSCLLWSAAAIAASGHWWPRPSVARMLMTFCCSLIALSLDLCVYMAPHGVAA